MSYIILYNYGKLEILMKEYYTNILQIHYVSKTLDAIDYYIASLKLYDTELIVSNNIISTTKLNNLLINYDYNVLKNIDLFIYTEVLNKSEKNKKIILYDISDLTNNIVTPDKCDFQFLSLNIKIRGSDSKNFDLELDSKSETYYIVGNRLNLLLFSYLLKSKHGISSNAVTLKYDIQVIDQNANIFTINECDEIVLFKDYYMIIPYDYEKSQINKLTNYNRVLLTLNNMKNIELYETNSFEEKEKEYDELSDNSDNSYEKLE
jgi:hypothetical protein